MYMRWHHVLEFSFASMCGSEKNLKTNRVHCSKRRVFKPVLFRTTHTRKREFQYMVPPHIHELLISESFYWIPATSSFNSSNKMFGCSCSSGGSFVLPRTSFKDQVPVRRQVSYVNMIRQFQVFFGLCVLNGQTSPLF